MLAAEREAAKYRAAFAQPSYRIKCHGLTVWDRHGSQLPNIRSAVDLGCGTGRLVASWLASGIDGYGVDLVADAAVDPEIWAKHSRRFTTETLWRYAPDRLFDLGICADVMEHIPERYVHETLSRMGACCRQLLLKIDTRASVVEGHTLHVTRRPLEWWQLACISALGAPVTVLERDERDRWFVLHWGIGC